VQILYPYLILVHVLAAFAFALAHGGTALVAFRVRREREPQRIAALLDLSNWSLALTYWSMLVLVAAGVAAGIIGGWFGRAWVWAAIGVLVAVTVAMLAYAAPYYQCIRQAVGQAGRRGGPAPEPVSAADLAALLDSRRPEGIAVVGGVGLALILWLMVLKPF
jgi:hypothetical protein